MSCVKILVVYLLLFAISPGCLAQRSWKAKVAERIFKTEWFAVADTAIRYDGTDSIHFYRRNDIKDQFRYYLHLDPHPHKKLMFIRFVFDLRRGGIVDPIFKPEKWKFYHHNKTEYVVIKNLVAKTTFRYEFLALFENRDSLSNFWLLPIH